MAKRATLRSVTNELQALNMKPDGAGDVGISSGGKVLYQAGLEEIDMAGCLAGNESLPGAGLPFDAAGAARRLLAEWHKAWPSS